MKLFAATNELSLVEVYLIYQIENQRYSKYKAQ